MAFGGEVIKKLLSYGFAVHLGYQALFNIFVNGIQYAFNDIKPESSAL
jgi:hypothetical protein